MRLALAATLLLTAGCTTTTPVQSDAPGTKRLPTAGMRTPSHAHPAMHRSSRRRPAASRSQHRLPWDSRLFNRLAQCESGNDWQANTGNGYYGGVQESLSFWRSFGGLAFAARPDLASRQQQITVAVRGLAVQGFGAWPVCSRLVGVR